MTLTPFAFFVGFLALGAPAIAQSHCFKTVHEVRANHVKAQWRETTENDGKPMTISIANGAGGLVYSAHKAGKLWLSGNISVCRAEGRIAITLENTKTTSNVPIFARASFPRTQSARIEGNHITLAAGGWSGTFVGN